MGRCRENGNAKEFLVLSAKDLDRVVIRVSGNNPLKVMEDFRRQMIDKYQYEHDGRGKK